MQNLEHEDIFEVLSIDLDLSPGKVKNILINKGTNDFKRYLKTKDLYLHKTDLILSSEIKDQYGKTLINKGIPLNKYMTSLLERYVKDSSFKTSPFLIECTEEALKMYRGKATDKMNSIIENHVYSSDEYAELFEKAKHIKYDFQNVLDTIMQSPKGISTLLKITSSFSDHKDIVLNSINSSLVTLGLADISGYKSSETGKIVTTKTGIVCMLKSINEISESSLCDNTSAEIVRMLVKDETLEQAAIMHSSATYDSAPIFTDSVNRTNYYLKMLVTVSLFVDLVYQNKTDAHNLEVHKSLYELAELGYADREVTSLLGKLFLPEAKALMLEYAYKLKTKCKYEPAIWSTVGDMLPVKFICTKDSCVNAGSHKTFIPKDIVIESQGAVTTSIVSGLYFTCNLLTENLQKYYKEIIRQQT